MPAKLNTCITIRMTMGMATSRTKSYANKHSKKTGDCILEGERGGEYKQSYKRFDKDYVRDPLLHAP